MQNNGENCWLQIRCDGEVKKGLTSVVDNLSAFAEFAIIKELLKTGRLMKPQVHNWSVEKRIRPFTVAKLQGEHLI